MIVTICIYSGIKLWASTITSVRRSVGQSVHRPAGSMSTPSQPAQTGHIHTIRNCTADGSVLIKTAIHSTNERCIHVDCMRFMISLAALGWLPPVAIPAVTFKTRAGFRGVSHQTPQFLKPCNSIANPFLKSQIRHWAQASHQLNPALFKTTMKHIHPYRHTVPQPCTWNVSYTRSNTPIIYDRCSLL